MFFLADAPALRTHCRNRILEISYQGVHVYSAMPNSIYLLSYIFGRYPWNLLRRGDVL